MRDVVEAIANLSKDRSTKVGAVITGPEGEIRSTGHNGFPRRVKEDIDSRHERPEKYFWSCHAEENAIVQAARSGVSVCGCTMHLYGLPPCTACTRMIIQSGISNLVVYLVDLPKLIWAEQFAISKQMLREASIHCRLVDEIKLVTFKSDSELDTWWVEGKWASRSEESKLTSKCLEGGAKELQLRYDLAMGFQT